MNNIVIKRTKSSPEVSFHPHESYLKICGNSYMDNTTEFYSSLFENLNEYFNSKSKKEFILELELNIVNDSSLMVISELFSLCVKAQDRGVHINIMWHYNNEDDATLELAEDYEKKFSELNIYLLSYSITAKSREYVCN